MKSSIRKKIVATMVTFAILIALLSVVMVYSNSLSSNIRNDLANAYEDYINASSIIYDQTKLEVDFPATVYSKAIFTGETDAAKTKFSAFMNSTFADLNAEQTNKDILTSIKPSHDMLYKSMNDIITLSNDFDKNSEQMLKIYLEDFVPSVKIVNDGMFKIAEFELNSAYAARKNADDLDNYVLIAMIILGVISVGFGYIRARKLSMHIVPPIKKIVQAVDALALGDTNQDAVVHTNDEIEILSNSVIRVQANMRAQSELAVKMSNRDITMDHMPLSDKDITGISLKNLVDGLNGVFSQISSSAKQVSEGSNQIADGAQMLAHGATQQAASVEQLSYSVDDISVKTKQNVDTAKEAASMATEIKSNAEAGSAQMEQLLKAVRDINAASSSIGKVIKVIDDIAFQTNILALNAAVEAARAGIHGKGFAVVADEVRNLAAKSAEAARDTSELIENSINQAELGERIANETSSSLQLIVSGIIQSAILVENIAMSSEEQYKAIQLVNDGISNVANVIQQNSAASEQSAAAAEEMSGQSDMLLDILSQIKLKQDSNQSLGELNYKSSSFSIDKF